MEKEPYKVRFTIPGDPVGYTRVTRGQLGFLRVPDLKLNDDQLEVKRRIQKYNGYKDLCYWTAVHCLFDRAPREKVFLNVVVYYSAGEGKFNRHPDPENVRKAVQDAIYQEDNKVAGCVDFHYDEANPRVEVEIVEY